MRLLGMLFVVTVASLCLGATPTTFHNVSPGSSLVDILNEMPREQWYSEGESPAKEQQRRAWFSEHVPAGLGPFVFTGVFLGWAHNIEEYKPPPPPTKDGRVQSMGIAIVRIGVVDVQGQKYTMIVRAHLIPTHDTFLWFPGKRISVYGRITLNDKVWLIDCVDHVAWSEIQLRPDVMDAAVIDTPEQIKAQKSPPPQ